MKRYFVVKSDINEALGKVTIQGQEFNHLKNVMRQKEGEEIVCFAGDGFDYLCKINKILKNEALCNILQKKPSLATPNQNVTLFQGSLKQDNFELVLQKSAELGLSRVVVFQSDFSVAKVRQEKLARYEKICLSASKQCGRSDVMQVEIMSSFKHMQKQLEDFELVVFAYEKEGKNTLSDVELSKYKGKKIALIVGSEGGFSKLEANKVIESGAVCVGLGKRILRAETAAISLSAITMHLLGEI